MLVLGLDTSSPAVAVALVDVATGEVLAERSVVDARRHGELLAPLVREVAPDLALVGAVAVGLGPGPYTGLRVGVVTAAALSDALGIPAYGTCSLDALGEGERTAVSDARRREVHWAAYAADGSRVEGPSVCAPGEVPLRGVVVGEGAALYELPGARPPLHPSAAALARLVGPRALAREPADPMTPLYLRRPDAEEPRAPKRVTA